MQEVEFSFDLDRNYCTFRATRGYSGNPEAEIKEAARRFSQELYLEKCSERNHREGWNADSYMAMLSEGI